MITERENGNERENTPRNERKSKEKNLELLKISCSLSEDKRKTTKILKIFSAANSKDACDGAQAHQLSDHFG